jgi:hypothetical protein
MVDEFTREQFEAALPINKHTGKTMWVGNGVQSGEYTYTIPIDGQVSIFVRSSVRSYGVSALSGEDSIRAWLVTSDGNPLGSKVSRWITRVKGWDKRMADTLRTLWGWRKAAGNCSCGRPMGIFVTKKKKVFAKCGHCSPTISDWNKVKWLTE